MILLDTNVVSEPLRPEPNVRVIDWLDAQPLETLYLSAMTVAELRAGVALMPAGQRRDKLNDCLEKSVLPPFAGRVLAFDLACTNSYAYVLATARRSGSGIGTADGLIAAVAVANGLIVATRNTSPFEAAGLIVINPWEG
ncbi:type II toxin-antitoxin system VapC family toxin [Tepidiphilus olei]|jgi:predicted nucleic acid-binding protein|uniref:type II toxin-antitoxin system VapC family toxin n=1 Tax=Tepidiphilus olei TaxID=2502184 RepID=UPI00115D77D0|nr:type II toxin-antitoxin system VapC family toxin [Tepidiphilus olei]